MIRVEWVYWLCGLVFVLIGVSRAMSQTRHNPDSEAAARLDLGSGTFWILLGVSFGYSTLVVDKTAPAWPLGIAVIVMTAMVATGRLRRGSDEGPSPAEQVTGANRFGNKLFLPALAIPAVVIIVAIGLKHVSVGGQPLLEPTDESLIGLGIAAIVAVAVALAITRPGSIVTPIREGGRLLSAIGWAALLPQMLSTLGTLFATAGVGTAVGDITKHVLPSGSRLGAVIVYCVGMALFTVIMGNAFAAFPIMTAAIGWPVLVQHFHGNPPAVFAIGMLAGFCGTLCTPMAANFNIVPAALLQMRDNYGPIKAQIPTAVPLLACNVVLMWLLAF